MNKIKKINKVPTLNLEFWTTLEIKIQTTRNAVTSLQFANCLGFILYNVFNHTHYTS